MILSDGSQIYRQFHCSATMEAAWNSLLFTPHITAANIRLPQMSKLSLLNCSANWNHAKTRWRGFLRESSGRPTLNFIFSFPPPHPPQFSHCGVAKFIPNLIALRQWKQCGIIYFLSSLNCQGGAKTQRPYNRIVSTIVSDGTRIFEPCYFKRGFVRAICVRYLS